MNNELTRIARILVLLGLAGLVALGAAAAEAEFSADLTIKTAAGLTISGKTFVKGPMRRNELTIGQRTMTTILRQDKKVTWVLLPSTHQYQQSSLRFDPLNPTSDVPYTTKELGTDKANGYDCKQILWTFKNPNLGSVLQWYCPALKTAVRFQMKDKAGALISTTDFRGVKPGPQAAALFEIPPGYTKVPGKE